MEYNSKHEEIPDKKPIALPLGYRAPEPLANMIARLIRVESLKAEAEGMESFEESDDFDIEDDDQLVSPYQMTQMQEEHPYVRTQQSGPEDNKISAPGGEKTTAKQTAEPTIAPLESAEKK